MTVTWGVVTTTNDPPPVILAQVAHHLSMGAARVRVVLDRPDAVAEALLSLLPGAECLVGDEEYWASRGIAQRPDHIHRRQRLNATFGLAEIPVEWLVHLDADEYLWCDGDALGERLGVIPDAYDWVRIPNLERCWIEGDDDPCFLAGAVRLTFTGPDDDACAVLGPMAEFTYRGLAGYQHGKSATRTGRGWKLGIHAPRGKEALPREFPLPGLRLVHFDGLTRRQWLHKMLRYEKLGLYDLARSNPAAAARTRQIDALARGGWTELAAAQLLSLIKVVTPAEAERLRLLGLLTKGPDFASAVRIALPDLDVSEAAVDAALATSLSSGPWRT